MGARTALGVQGTRRVRRALLSTAAAITLIVPLGAKPAMADPPPTTAASTTTTAAPATPTTPTAVAGSTTTAAPTATAGPTTTTTASAPTTTPVPTTTAAAVPTTAPPEAPPVPPEAEVASLGLTVTPDTDLVSGQVVDVAVSGAPPEASVGAAICLAGATDLFQCSLATAVMFYADAEGDASTDLTLRRRISAGGEIVDCASAPGTCAVGVATLPDFGITATAPLSFDPDAPLPSPSLTVDPDEDLVDRQQVTIDGSGWPVDSSLGILQCPAGEGPYDCIGPWAEAWAETGEFSATMQVRRMVRTDDGPTVDCASTPGACEIVAYVYGDYDWMARVPLAFDPDGPLPDPPSVTVTPNSDLVDRQEVLIEGANFTSHSWVSLELCDAAGSECRWIDTGIELVTDATGAFSAGVRLRRLIPVFEADPIDCAVDACVVVATVYESYLEQAQTAVSFDPGVPLPDPPTVSADPATDLVDHQVVAVSGAGWTPGATVLVRQCTTVPDYGEQCGGVERSLTADDSGSLTGTAIVLRNLPFWGYEEPGTVDCATAAGVCWLAAIDASDWFERASAPLSFDPDAPLAPPPTLDADPSTDLVDQQEIALHGEGFLPGDTVSVDQCGPGDEPSCRGWTSVTAGDDGAFDATFVARRLIGSSYRPLVDCAIEACVVRALSWTDPTGEATASLAFDPDVMPILPVVTVEPNVGLADGQSVVVHGSEFTPYATVVVGQCRGDATSATECDQSDYKMFNAGPEGTFETNFVVDSVIQVGDESVDCTAQPGACLIGAANLSDFSEANRDWLTFGDPPVASAGSASVDEGDDGTVTVEVPVNLSAPSMAPVSVGYSLAGGTAGSGDFSAATGTLEFPPGETSASVTVEVVGDELDELDETVNVVLSEPVHAAAAAEPGVVTVLDDDQPDVRAGVGWVREGDRGTRVLRIPVRLSAPSPGEVTVRVRTAAFTARPRSDYVEYEGTVTFAPGDAEQMVEVTVRGDRRREGPELLLLRLSVAAGATIVWPGVGLGVIIDDD